MPHRPGLLPLCCLLCLIPAAALAGELSFWPEAPILPGRQELYFYLPQEPAVLRANVFSAESAIAAEAWLEDGRLLCLRLLRPLDQGEQILVSLDGEDLQGQPLAMERSFDVSRAGALRETLFQISDRVRQWSAQGMPDAENTVHGLPFQDCMLLAPRLAADTQSGLVRMDDAASQWRVSVFEGGESGRGFGCHLQGTAEYVLNAGDFASLRAPDTIIVSGQTACEGVLIQVYYQYDYRPDPQLLLADVHLKPPRAEDPSFEWVARPDESGLDCTFCIKHSGLPAKYLKYRIQTERTPLP